MPVLNDYSCKKCGKVVDDRWEPGRCCNQTRKVALSPVFSPEWGSSRELLHLREGPFGSRSELAYYVKKEGLVQAPSAEKHHGARNEDYLNLGKKYSYAGSPKG